MREEFEQIFITRFLFFIKHTHLYACFVLLIMCNNPSLAVSAEAVVAHAHVLVISSYHIGYGGTDPMITGIREAFSDRGQKVDFYVEYLDSKRFSPTVLFPYLEQLYQEKYAESEFDVIIVADNNAFNFIRKVRNDIFAHVPVVFCGINNFQHSMLDGFEGVTGVTEDISLKQTVELALSIHPDTKYLAVVSDSTTTGFANMQKFLEIKKELPKSLAILDLTNLSATELAEQLEALPERTVLLQLSFYMDRDGKQFTQKEQMEFIRTHFDKPIYSAWDFFIAHGVVGGVVTSFPLQGQMAGEIAIRIINGTPADTIPVVTKSPNIPLFDSRALEQFDVSLSALPRESIVLNKPEEFLYKYNILVLISSLFLVTLFLIIGVLFFAIKRQKRTGQLLLQSEQAYRDLFENMAEGAFYKTRDGKLSNVNSAALKMFGVTREQFIGRTCADHQWKIIREDGTDVLVGEHPSSRVLKTGNACLEIVQGIHNRKTNAQTWVVVNAIPQLREGEKEPYQVFVTMHDITARIHSEELLRIEHEMSVKLNKVSQLYEGLEVCLDASLDGAGMDVGGIYLIDQKSGVLDLICHKGLSENFVRKGSHWAADSDRYKLIEKKKPIYTTYENLEISIMDSKMSADLKAICVIPIVHQNELVGCLNIASHTKDSLPDFTRVAIETIAGHIGRWVNHCRTVQILSESEDRFVLAMNSVSDGLFDWNLESNSVYFSPGWKKILGYKEDEIKNDLTEWERLTSPKDVKRFWAMFDALINKKRDHFALELKMKHKAGHWVDILSRAKVIEDSSGKAARMVGTHVDISERKEFEKSIIEQKQIAERYLNLAGVMFIGIDSSGAVNLANKKACEILEAERGDILGHNWFDNFVPEKSRLGVLSVYTQLMEGTVEPAEYNENLVLTKGGQEKHIAWHQAILRDNNGKTVGILCSGDDVTEKKQLEFKLQQVQKMESIGNLAGGIAHDFNNILSSILGFTELSIETVEKGSQVEANLQEVYSAGKRARDLVKQILTFARRSDEEIRPIQPKTIAREVLQFIRSSIPTTIDIQQELQSDSLIMGNATQMHQILMNLCTNAAYAMEDEGGLLKTGVKDIAIDSSSKWKYLGLKPGNYIEVFVSDTGTGITPDVIDKIFEPYFTTKAAGEGTGLGLALVHGIVESYGGRVSVDSILGKGTTFTLYLPSTKKNSGTISYEPEILPTGSERILFVDDEDSLTTIAGLILRQLGYQVVTKTNSNEALELFEATPEDFDLVISDMTMPHITGDKLAVEMMKIREDIPVIICTGYSKKMSQSLMTEIGISAVAFKPIVKADFAKKIRNVLDSAKKN